MMADAKQRAARWLQAWDSQGIHRTGTPGDEAGADWLLAEAAALGATPVVESCAVGPGAPGGAVGGVGRAHRGKTSTKGERGCGGGGG